MYVRLCVYMDHCMYVYVHACMHACMHACIHAWAHIHAYMLRCMLSAISRRVPLSQSMRKDQMDNRDPPPGAHMSAPVDCPVREHV